MSVSLIVGSNLDFSSCNILVGFCKSSHVLLCGERNMAINFGWMLPVLFPSIGNFESS